MSTYLKPQSPLYDKNKDTYFYPLTTADQVIMENGSRLNTIFKTTVRETVTLLADNWSADAPYTQTVTFSDVDFDDLNVDANVAYTGNIESDLELNKGYSCVSYVKKAGNSITFFCLKDKPAIDMPVEIVGTSYNTMATVEEGTKLNFDIVAYDSEEELLADTPMENTIGVVTTIPITEWIFSAEEPFDTTTYSKYIVEDTGTVLGTISGRTYTKQNDGRAAFAFVSAGGYVGPMLVSPVQSAAAYTTSGNYSSTQTATDTVIYNGTTYYYPSGAWMGGASLDGLTPSFSTSSNAEAALILAEIYENALAKKEEASRYEGIVWFSVGTKSHVEFNALKKNAIQIYPMSAKQYINGVWKDVTTMIYNGSEWTEWKNFLFSNGSQCEDVTGGWLDRDILYSGDTGTESLINADSMSFQGFHPQRVTANKIDVSDCTRVHVTIVDAVTGEFRLYLSSDGKGYQNLTGDTLITTLVLQKPQAGTYSLDVSSLSGSYYVHVGAYNTSYFRVTEIYKE